MSLHGFRWFDVGQDGSLQSVNNIVWAPNEPYAAECEKLNGTQGYGAATHPASDVPNLECTCGCWAFYDPEDAWSLREAWNNATYRNHCKAFACVEAWGGIVEHEHGFRAEFMEVRSIFVMRGLLHPCYSDVIRYRNLDELLAVWDTGFRKAVN